MTCCCPVAQLCLMLCDPIDCSMLGIPVLHYLQEFTQTCAHWIGDVIQPSHLLSSPSPPALNISQHQGLFKWVSSSHQVAKVLELQLQHQFFQWLFRFTSFRIYWLDLLAVQGTLKNLLQHHSSKSSILWHSVFFMVQLLHPYMTTGKTITLTTWTVVCKVMFLLLNKLSRLVIAFHPRSKCLLISWLLSPSAVILEPKKLKSVTVSICFPIYLPWRGGTWCHDLPFSNDEFQASFSLSSFTFIRGFTFAIRVVSSVYLRLLIFLLGILIPAWASCSPTFHIIHSA